MFSRESMTRNCIYTKIYGGRKTSLHSAEISRIIDEHKYRNTEEYSAHLVFCLATDSYGNIRENLLDNRNKFVKF
jgi:hypothetical protein